MQLDLTDSETLALLNLQSETIEADRFPLSPRIHMFRGTLEKFGAVAPAPSAAGEVIDFGDALAACTRLVSAVYGSKVRD